MTLGEATNRLQGIPFIRAIGMRAVDVGADVSRCHLPARPAFAAKAGSEHLCEGLIAAAVDQAGSMAIWAGAGLSLPHATICLGLSLLAPARLADLILETRLLAISDTLGQTEVRVLQDGQPIARGHVDFMLGRYPGAAGPSETKPLADPARLDGTLITALDGDCFAAALGLPATSEGHHHLPYTANLVGSRDPVALHGGALAAASLAAARSALGPDRGLRLIDISIDYLRSALPLPSSLQSTLISRTRNTALVETDVRQHGATRHVTRTRARFCSM